MKRQLPTLTSDEAAEDFVTNADLTDYDLSGLVRVRFELKPESKTVDPQESLLEAGRERIKPR